MNTIHGNYIIAIDENGNVVGAAASSVGTGNKATVTAGTRVQLATSTACVKVNIQAKASNSDYVYVGGSAVSATSGIALSPTSSITLNINDLSLIYIDSAVSGEGVTYLYEA